MQDRSVHRSVEWDGVTSSVVTKRRMPLGLGYWSNFVYIWVAFGLEGGNRSSGAGWRSKRKFWRSGPNLPRGSVAKGKKHIPVK